MIVKRVGLVSVHTSPLETPGSRDAGGLNVYVVALAEALARESIDVEIVTRSSTDGAPFDEYTPEGVRVRYLRAGPPRVVSKEELPAIVGRFQYELAQVPQFDILHSHYWLSGLAALPVAHMQGIPHIQSLHTVGALKNELLAPGDEPEPESRLNGERMLISRSAATLVSTEVERDVLIDAYGAQASRIDLIEPGVDNRLFHPRVAPGDPGQRPFLLALGRIQPLKGQDLALRTLAAISPALRPDLIIAGSATPGQQQYFQSLVTLAHDLGLADRVRFVGTQTREQSADLLRRASLVLATSHSETFGLVPLEAAASGTPVLAQRVAGLTSSVSDGISGVLLESRSPHEWAVAVTELLQNPAALRRLGASAVRFAQHHDWDATARATLGAYRRAAGSERPLTAK